MALIYRENPVRHGPRLVSLGRVSIGDWPSAGVHTIAREERYGRRLCRACFVTRPSAQAMP